MRPAGILPTGVRARTAVLLMVLTFAIGLLTGLGAQRLTAPSSGQTAVSAGALSAAIDAQAYQAYRQGERIDLSAAPVAAEQAWLSYRQGERSDLVTTPQAVQQAWLSYRQGERSDLVTTPQAAEQAWLSYRQGERADLSSP